MPGTTQTTTPAVRTEHPAIANPPRLSKMGGCSLHNLSTCGTIVFFTPVITPAASGKVTNNPAHRVDPFETLGRALSRHHKRIRHVPYVPKVGFTETHDAFISQADAVIVVICEPHSSRTEGLSEQVAFAEAAQECMESNDHVARDHHDDNNDSIILIQLGDVGAHFWPDTSRFDRVLKRRVHDVAAAAGSGMNALRTEEVTLEYDDALRSRR